jgi:ligand-binding SRPBCC domain-containing protein
MEFVHESHFSTTPEAVFALHERADVFQILTPPWQKVRVMQRQGGLRIGARVEFRLYVGPVFLTWVARHTEYEPNRLFTDVQDKGPFRTWRHRHRFLGDGNGGCVLRDEIEYTLPLGLERVAGWLVEKDLRRMFAYRHAATARALGVQ